MKRTSKPEDTVEVPAKWLEGLLELATNAEERLNALPVDKNGCSFIRLVGYCQSAKSILKFNNKL